MERIKWCFGLLLVLLTGLWLSVDTLLPDPLTYFSFRHAFVQYTGFLGIAVMSVAMLLALRPQWLERPLGGLDKVYRLHKWLGVSALVFSVLHWWWAQGTKWMVGWGWLDRPERRSQADPGLSQFEHWLRGQRGLAESLGEWAFYGVVILIVLALVKWFPYYWFRKSHQWLALIYLVLIYHSLILVEAAYWSHPLGWILAVILVMGLMSALVVMSGRVGSRRKVKGVIKAINFYPGVRVVEGTIQLAPGWKGHKPGQFAFVTSKKSEGAHPYTIASAWSDEERCLTFVVKSLGDWTGQLQDWLKVDMPVTVEGPYGCFDFEDQHSKQIWIGAGIGITPFIAKMTQLSRSPGIKVVDLFHATSDFDQAAIDKLTADAKAANVRLHLRLTRTEGPLTPEQIREQVPDWQSAGVWFCGPVKYGKALKRDLTRHGLPSRQFHQELFSMR